MRESDSLAVDLRARNVARGARVDAQTLPLTHALDDAFLRGQIKEAVARIDSALRAQPLTATMWPGTMRDAAIN